ncbi:MAG: ribulokinase [Phycisphaerae bacterium]|jgi:L-ribulokinase|nr:ribulokinase [Phycisphaerae bacterium]
MTSTSRYSIGVDYGTASVRAVVVDVDSGAEIAASSWGYAHGRDGVVVDSNEPDLARQHPADYAEGFRRVVGEAVSMARSVRGFSSDRVVGIGIDTTGSTPLPVDAAGIALATLPQFAHEPAAMAWLWKDHSSHAEAAEITDRIRRTDRPYLDTCGGTYSSEWYWSKILRCTRTRPEVAAAAYTWVELCDYVPALVTGTAHPQRLVRSICAAGHKAMYHPRWGGLPSAAFLDELAEGLGRLRDRYAGPVVAADRPVGGLLATWAAEVGLPAGIPVAAGAFDAHMGAVGAGVAPGTLVKIMGTSTCDCMVAPMPRAGEREIDIPGVCGIVPESILPGMLGIEAGQSAVGDIFDWYANRMAGDVGPSAAERHARLTEAAAALAPGESGLLALDWHNGNRTILVNPRLSGAVIGQSLHTTHGEMYRALIEATAFGALRIIERIEECGVPVRDVVACGGLAERNPLIMQIYADVCGRPIAVSRSPQTCALGAAIFGAVVGKAHPDVAAAQRAMAGVREERHHPHPDRHATYRTLYSLYRQLHDAFGTRENIGSLHGVMKELLRLRDAARASRKGTVR